MAYMLTQPGFIEATEVLYVLKLPWDRLPAPTDDTPDLPLCYRSTYTVVVRMFLV